MDEVERACRRIVKVEFVAQQSYILKPVSLDLRFLYGAKNSTMHEHLLLNSLENTEIPLPVPKVCPGILSDAIPCTSRMTQEPSLECAQCTHSMYVSGRGTFTRICLDIKHPLIINGCYIRDLRPNSIYMLCLAVVYLSNINIRPKYILLLCLNMPHRYPLRSRQRKSHTH